MFANQRRNKINEMIKKDGAVNASALAKLFDVSIETIRKDLLIMEQQGLLHKVHGGAVGLIEMKSFENLGVRNTKNLALKTELSKIAADFISEGDCIAIDSGSTAIAFAEELKKKFKRLTVVTHSKDVFDILCSFEEFNVILCAGHYLKSENSFCGQFALNIIKELHFKKAFIFPSAISLKYGVFDFQKELLEVQKALISSADEIFLLADSSKFEKTGLLKLCNINENFVFITDSELSDELENMYSQNGVRVVC